MRHLVDRAMRIAEVERTGLLDPSELDLMQQCDTLLMVGTSFPYSEFLLPKGAYTGPTLSLLLH